MKTFSEMTSTELWKLRKEIILNSCNISDYKNSYGFDEKCMSDFFDGYYDYIWELAEEENECPTHKMVMQGYDNEKNLYAWFNCYDDLDWVKHSIQ